MSRHGLGFIVMLALAFWAEFGLGGHVPNRLPSQESARDSARDDLVLREKRPAFNKTLSDLFHPEIGSDSLRRALSDQDSRIPAEFKIPEPLRNRVSFWLRVYTEWSSQQIALFDREHPEVVYEVLDFRPLAKKARNAAAFEILSRRQLSQTIHKYRLAFRALQSKNKRAQTSPEAQKILAAISPLKHKHTFRDLERGLITQWGQRDSIMRGLLSAELFFPKIEEIFRGYGIPAALSRLSLVESSFNLKAVSRKNAVGVWQFIPETGKQFLTISNQIKVDERLSPLKSSKAAAELLADNFRLLRNWPLSITAYNHGWRGLPLVKKSAHDEELLYQWFDGCAKKHSPLGYASRNYYATFLAVLHAEAYRDLFYGESVRPKDLQLEFITLTTPKSATEVAVGSGLNLQEFRFFNPDVTDLQVKLPRGFVLAIPSKKSGTLEALLKPALRRKTISVSQYGPTILTTPADVKKSSDPT